MKKEKLKELGLTEEQIRAVLDENSRDLQKARDKDAAAKLWEEERAALETQCGVWKEKAESLEGIWQKKLEESRYEMTLSHQLEKAGARNRKAVRALICEEGLQVGEDGAIAGLAEQIAQVRAENSYLFEEKSVPQFIRFGGVSGGADEEKVRQIMGLAKE